MFRKVIAVMIITMIFILGTLSKVNAEEDIVISLGKDLTEQQQSEIIEIFGAKDDAKIIYVTNEEEKEYLSNYIKEEVIGSRAISSAYVKRLGDNRGINVETYNISWVTKEMYMNALVTAGIKNAEVKVASPIEVSGTAALTGIIKAFEDISGKKIGEEEKRTANEEIAKTGQLAENIGKDKASKLIKEIKEEVIDKNINNEEQIRKIVVEVTGELNIKLDEQQINDIISLMKNISGLNLNIQDIQGQLKNITNEIREVAEDNKEVKSILQQILDFIKDLFNSLVTWLGDI